MERKVSGIQQFQKYSTACFYSYVSGVSILTTSINLEDYDIRIAIPLDGRQRTRSSREAKRSADDRYPIPTSGVRVSRVSATRVASHVCPTSRFSNVERHDKRKRDWILHVGYRCQAIRIDSKLSRFGYRLNTIRDLITRIYDL